jgi:hypothetical protein
MLSMSNYGERLCGNVVPIRGIQPRGMELKKYGEEK